MKGKLFSKRVPALILCVLMIVGCAQFGALAVTGEEYLCLGGSGHLYRTYEILEEPTCTRQGVDLLMCDRCGATREEVTPALGHDYVFRGWMLNRLPVCTADYDFTSAEYTCSRCGEIRSIYYHKGDDWHSWEAGYVKAPTVNEEGYTVYTCSVCGATKHADPVPKLGTTYPVPFHGFAYNETEYNVSVVGSSRYTFTTFSEATQITVPFSATVGAYLGGTLKYSYTDGKPVTAAFLRGENLDIIPDNFYKFKPYCDIVIEGSSDNYPFSVYLEDFGTTVYTTGERYNPETGRIEEYQVPHATKGIRSITINGNNVSVYLTNSNLGFLDYNNQDDPEYNYSHKQATVTVNGWGSGVYMGNESNYGKPGLVHCDVNISAQETGSYTYYDTDLGDSFYQLREGFSTAPVSDFAGAVRLCNVTVDSMQSADAANGVLNGYASVELVNSVYQPENGITLNDHAALTVTKTDLAKKGEHEVYDEEYDYTYTEYGLYDAVPITLNDRTSLCIDDSAVANVTFNGIHTIRVNDARFYGNILLSEEETMIVDSFSAPVASGVRVTMKLGGKNKTETPNRSNGQTPDIMVANSARLIIKDDDQIAGVGELTVGSEYDDGGHYYCAAIGGTPAIEPLPHGRVAVVSGVLTAYASSGGAAIGGSTLDPYIAYEVLEEGYYPAYEGDPANVVSIYINSSVGYRYYDTVDDRYNPYAGGWWLQKSGNDYYPVDENRNRIYIPEVCSDEVDYENSTPGFSRDGGSVVISGGVVNVTASMGGAAIGGANGGNGGVIQVAGGTVNAKSSGLSAAIGGGAVNWGTPTRRAIAFLEAPADGDWDAFNFATAQRIWIDSYTYDPSMGGGSGAILVTGACVINATSDNPGYDEFGNPINKPQEYYTSRDGYDTISDWNAPEDIWYGPGNDHPKITWDELKAEFTNGKQPGYVFGSSTEAANKYYENTTEILTIGGIDGNPCLVLRQAETTAYYSEVDVTWSGFYREMNPPDHPFTGDALERPTPASGYQDNTFEPSRITGACLILKIGKVQAKDLYDENNEYIGTEDARYEIQTVAADHCAYRLRGEISLPEIDYLYVIPDGTSFTLLNGTMMTVGEGFRIIATDPDQFIVEKGAAVKGKGTWPGKPTVSPKNAPNTEQIKSLLRLTEDEVDSETGELIVATHLCVAQTSDGCVIIAGNGAGEVRSKAAALSLPVLTVISAGHYKFKKSDIEGAVSWSLNSADENTVVSLVENGALTASPGAHTTANHAFDVIVAESGTDVTVTLRSPILSSPKYTVFEGQPDEEICFTFAPDDYAGDLAFELTLTDEQVLNNKAIFSIPSFAGSEFKLNKISALKDKCALRFGGVMSFSTPVADFAGINVNQIQFKYGETTTLDGIDGGGYVSVPSIAGFPVTGDASITLNTFGGQREFSMSVNLETPIFEGAFAVEFKEARGIIMLDTIYAEIAAGEGGIPLVPPTVIGYLQGGGLGISGLADTINMNSLGAPPVRLNIAAKGSILDVIEGWIRLSVGLDGFDLQMTDIEVANLEFIKEVGVSAKWDAGEQTINGKTYWGISTDMSQYMVIAIPVPYADDFGDDESLPLLLSASGSIGFGGFTGYYIENGWAYFIYRLHASGSLTGSLTIPKKLIANTFPFSTIELANAEIGFYAAATASTQVNASAVNGSAANVLRQLASNADIRFDAAVGAKLVVGTGPFKFYLRAVYVFGDKGIDLSAGYGSGSSLDLGDLVNRSRISNKKYAMIGEVVDERTGESVPAILEAGMESVALLEMSGDKQSENADGIVLTRMRATGSFNAEVGAAAVGNTFLAIRLEDETAILTPADLTVTRDGQTVALTEAQFDECGNQTGNGNFFADEGVVYFAPEQAGSYTIVSNAAIESVEAIETTIFASLDAENTTIGNGVASYKIDDADESRVYKAQLVLGKTEGAGDCLIDESAILTGSASYTGDLPYALTGSLLPTGDYYPSILLLEYIEAQGENGETAATWTLVDQKSFSDVVHYENDTIPAAPENVVLTYSGNATMTASWDAVAGADSYQIAVYDENGNDTGLFFRTNGASETLVMDLSSLDENEEYFVGVKAVFRSSGDDDLYQLSCEGTSGAAVLIKADPPQVTYSSNVVSGENGRSALVIGADGGIFTVTGQTPLDFTVSNARTGEIIASAEGQTRLTVNISTQDANGQLSLMLTAKDPQTGEYVLEYFDVSVDTVAPPLVLDHLGVFPVHGTDYGNMIYVTGHSEAGDYIYVWQDGEVLTSAEVSGDGSFFIPVVFEGEPGFTVQAMDLAGNLSAALSVASPAQRVTVTLDPGENAICATASIALEPGTAIDVLPAAYMVNMRLVGWVTSDGTGVGENTVFTEDTTLYAQWQSAGVNSYDLNGDGSVTVADVTALLDYIAGASDEDYSVAGDFTGDGSVTVADVTALLDYIASA